MTYFVPVSKENGLNSLAENPCNLLDFQLLSLNDGQEYTSASGDREILAVLFGGKADFTIGDQTFAQVGGRSSVFTGKPHAVYIPCQTDFTITGVGSVQIGLCSAPSELDIAPYVVTPNDVTDGVWGAANFTRNFHQILTATGQPDLPAARLIVGETYTPSGNWSTYPPHKHEVEDLPNEAFHEEMYYFKVNPADGFGLTRFQNDKVDDSHVINDSTILMMPDGYHTVVSAPGYTTYYLWFLAGNHRVQAVASDPNVGWVGRTVGMLRELGH